MITTSIVTSLPAKDIWKVDRQEVLERSWMGSDSHSPSIARKALIEAVMERQGALRMIDIAWDRFLCIFRFETNRQSPDLQAVCQDLDPQRLDEGRAAAAAAGLKKHHIPQRKCF